VTLEGGERYATIRGGGTELRQIGEVAIGEKGGGHESHLYCAKGGQLGKELHGVRGGRGKYSFRKERKDIHFKYTVGKTPKNPP